jgi:HNH endonuclease
MTNGIKGIKGFPSRPIQDRFWEKVNKDGPMCERLGTQCWVWIGFIHKNGYGRVYTKAHGSTKAHRVSWEMANGEIPEGIEVCHRCDNPPCIRPDHLFLGTHLDNITDMINKGRRRPSSSVDSSGEHNPHHELTNNDVIAMRERYAQGGISTASLAKIYKTNPHNVRLIIRRMAWKCVN